jgi:alcohol dehydrogenase
VFFAPAIADTVRAVGKIFKNAGYIDADLGGLTGKALGVAVAHGMFRFAEAIGFPTRLEQVENISEAHLTRALAAAKDPQLKMKLENMPVPLTAGMIDEYMGPVLRAAMNGDLSIIKTVS